jgi:catalase
VAYVPAVQPLFENAGVWSRRDDGFFDVSSGKDAAASFIETCGKLRFWDRESVKQD